MNCEFVFWNFIGTFPISTISHLDEPYKAEPLCPLCVCVCERERERDLQVQEVFFYFGHGRVRLFGELKTNFVKF